MFPVKKILACLVAGLASVCSTAAFAEPADQVLAQVYSVKRKLQSNGWAETHNHRLDALRQGQSDSFNFRLENNTTYKIVAVCDDDCSDIDMALYDGNGNRVDVDTSSDDLPILTVSPRWTGKFSLRVAMARCHNNPCAYGIVIMGR